MQSAIISVDPEVMHGTPVFKGTRVPSDLFFDFIRDGGTVNEFVEQYPTVTREQLEGLLNEASEAVIGN